MGTEITVYTGQSRSIRVTPSKKLRLTLVHELLQPGEEIISVSNEEQRFTSISQISETQNVRTQAWTVQCREDLHRKLDDITAELSKLRSDMSVLKNTLAPSHIRNLAAQVLLDAVATLKLPDTEHRFQDLAKQQYQPLIDFAEQLNVRPAMFAARADAVIKRRNKTIHRQVLHEEVQTAQTLLDNHPDMRQQFKHETEILQNFDLLRNSFGIA